MQNCGTRHQVTIIVYKVTVTVAFKLSIATFQTIALSGFELVLCVCNLG